jgi:hypothetical protein
MAGDGGRFHPDGSLSNLNLGLPHLPIDFVALLELDDE